MRTDGGKISRTMALLLRHDPGAGGLTLDAEGWVPVADLVVSLTRRGFPATLDAVTAIVAADEKRRYSIVGGRIRANQGHSVPIDLKLALLEPPALLFHGTAAHLLPSIRLEGLKRMKRHHVHLSETAAVAEQVGRRRGQPVVLTIKAGVMHAASTAFHRSENGVWLVDAVQPGWIDWEAVPATQAVVMPGSLQHSFDLSR